MENKVKIYCDMDGVLTDFHEAFEMEVGRQPKDYENTFGQDRLFDRIAMIINFWVDMPWTEDGKELWNYIKKHKPKILTTPAYSDEECKPGKTAWVQREIEGYVPIIFETQKEKYAEPSAILIDDTEENTLAFNLAGGTAIHHKDAKQTIALLKRLRL